MNEIKVSVYCLAYNHEKYIRQALEGFVQQKTTFPYEVIVHDDASTDGTAAIIREYELKYPDIIKPIYQKENQYSKDKRIVKNFILPRLSGEYIACCEGDDYWTSTEKLQKQVEYLDSHPEYSACVHDTVQLNMLTGESKLINGSQKDGDITFQQVVEGGNNCFQMSALMYRRQYAFNRPDFFTKAKGFGDYPLSIFLVTSGKVRFIAEAMSTYRFLSEGSWTLRNQGADNIRKIERFESVIEMLKSVDEYTDNKYHKQIERVITRNYFEIDRVKNGHIVFRFRYIPLYTQKIANRIKRMCLAQKGGL